MSSDLDNSSNVKVTKLPKMGKVILTLENCQIPENKLTPTPSQVDNLNPETEYELRIVGCEMIQTAGILLRLPQVAMATGQVLFQRFYYCKSFVRYQMETTAMGCLCLASKIEESPRRIRDVINVVHHMKQVKGGKKIQPMILDSNYISLKNEVIKAERRVLKELGFCVHVKHPHKIIVVFLQFLGYEQNRRFAQMSWNYMNDALHTDVFVRYQPETIAVACIFLSARFLGIALPKSPTWYSLFGVDEESICNVCRKILALYKRKRIDVEDLEKKVEELRRVYQESRVKNLVTKFNANNNTLTANGQVKSPASHPTSPNHHKNGSSDQKDSKSNDTNRRKRSHSRSRSPSEKSHKRHHKKHHRSREHKKTHKRRTYSKSLSLSPERRNLPRKHTHYRSRSRSVERTRDYDKYDYTYSRYKSSKHRDDRSTYKSDRR